MSKIITTIICLVFLLEGSTYAQYPGMGAVYNRMNQQFINQQMNTMMSMNMRWSMYLSDETNPEMDYTVFMKDSVYKYLSTKIFMDTTLHKSYLIVEDSLLSKKNPKRYKKIYVDKTINISAFDSKGYVALGIANDTCWMFKVIHGPISAYTYLPGTTEVFEKSAITGIQIGTGPIEKYNPDNLKKMIDADGEALVLFDKKKYFKALEKYNENALKAARKKRKNK